MERFKGHIPFLDGVRGLAVILVFLSHCAPNSVRISVFHFGWTGVDLFFVLSGFLITGILLDTKEKGKPDFFKNFFARRFLRLFPLYYGVLLAVIYIIPAVGGTITNLQSLLDCQIYFWTYTQNIFLAINGVPDFLGFTHFWSLATEEQFYLFWPFLVRYLSKRNLIIIIGLGVLISPLVRSLNPNVPFAYMFPLCRTEGLLLGGLAAILIRENYAWLSKSIYPLLIVSALFVAFTVQLGSSWSNATKPFILFGYTAVDIFFFALILALHKSGKLASMVRRLFELKFLTEAGKYSYGIYVYHFLFVWLLFDENVPDLVAFAQVTVLTLIVSILSFHLYENQFLKLKQRFYA